MTTHERTATRAVLPALPNRETIAVSLMIDERDNVREHYVTPDAFPIDYAASLTDRVRALLPNAHDDDVPALAAILRDAIAGDTDAVETAVTALIDRGALPASAFEAFADWCVGAIDDGAAAPAARAIDTRRADAIGRQSRTIAGRWTPADTADSAGVNTAAHVETIAQYRRMWHRGAITRDEYRTMVDALYGALPVAVIDEETRERYAGTVDDLIGTDARSWEHIVAVADTYAVRDMWGLSISGKSDPTVLQTATRSRRKHAAYRPTRVTPRDARENTNGRTRGIKLVRLDHTAGNVTYLASETVRANGRSRRDRVRFVHDGRVWHAVTIDTTTRKPRGKGERVRPSDVVQCDDVTAHPIDEHMTERVAAVFEARQSRVVRLGDAVRSADAPAPDMATRYVPAADVPAARYAVTDGRVRVSVVDMDNGRTWRVAFALIDTHGRLVQRVTRTNVRPGGVSRALAAYLSNRDPIA